MRIPVGNFGTITPEHTPQPDSSPVYEATVRLGQIISRIGEQKFDEDQSVKRMQDSNAVTQYHLALDAQRNKVTQSLTAKKVPVDQWQPQIESQLGSVPKPKATAFGPEAQAAVSVANQQALARTLYNASADIQAARGVQAEQTADDGFNLTAKEGEQLGTPVDKLLQRGDALADAAVQAGGDPAVVAAKQKQFMVNLAHIQARRDPQGTLAALDQPDAGQGVFDKLPFAAREEVRDTAKNQIVKQQSNAIVNTFATHGTDAGTKALADLGSTGLSIDLQDQVRARTNSAVAQLRDQRRQEHADDIANIETGIATDSASLDTLKRVHQLYQAGALTPGENASYTARIESSIVDRNKNAAAAQAIVDALQSGLPLDPSSPEHRKAVAGAFANETTGMPLGSQAWQSTAIGLADHTRMLPDQASAWTRQAMRSPNATIAANAAQFYGAVQTAAPDAASSFDEHTKAFAGMVNGMIEAGTDPQKAVEIARSNVFEQKPELTKQRETQYSGGGQKSFAATSDNALKQFIGNDFGHWYASNPAPTANLSADFNSQAQRYFVKTGDITLARKLAWDDLKRVYGESEVNGSKQIMAFPPERFGVKPEDVRADISNFLKGNPQADGSGAADIYLVPDSMTLRAVGDALTGGNVRPSYKLVTKSGDLVIDRNGVAKRYTLPSGEQLAEHIRAMQNEAAAKAQTIVERARQQRDFDRQLEEYKNSTVLP